MDAANYLGDDVSMLGPSPSLLNIAPFMLLFHGTVMKMCLSIKTGELCNEKLQLTICELREDNGIFEMLYVDVY